jgi:Orsellinic acid/F9775 biosynthesis cluster protein D
MNSDTAFHKLVNDLIIYHEDIGLAICRPCRIAFPTDPERHLLKYHKTLCLPERQALVHHIQALPERRSFEQIHSDFSTGVERRAIDGLDIIKGWKCNECSVVGAETTVVRHCRVHGWTSGQRNTY